MIIIFLQVHNRRPSSSSPSNSLRYSYSSIQSHLSTKQAIFFSFRSHQTILNQLQNAVLQHPRHHRPLLCQRCCPAPKRRCPSRLVPVHRQGNHRNRRTSDPKCLLKIGFSGPIWFKQWQVFHWWLPNPWRCIPEWVRSGRKFWLQMLLKLNIWAQGRIGSYALCSIMAMDRRWRT